MTHSDPPALTGSHPADAGTPTGRSPSRIADGVRTRADATARRARRRRSSRTTHGQSSNRHTQASRHAHTRAQRHDDGHDAPPFQTEVLDASDSFSLPPGVQLLSDNATGAPIGFQVGEQVVSFDQMGASPQRMRTPVGQQVDTMCTALEEILLGVDRARFIAHGEIDARMADQVLGRWRGLWQHLRTNHKLNRTATDVTTAVVADMIQLIADFAGAQRKLWLLAQESEREAIEADNEDRSWWQQRRRIEHEVRFTNTHGDDAQAHRRAMDMAKLTVDGDVRKIRAQGEIDVRKAEAEQQARLTLQAERQQHQMTQHILGKRGEMLEFLDRMQEIYHAQPNVAVAEMIRTIELALLSQERLSDAVAKGDDVIAQQVMEATQDAMAEIYLNAPKLYNQFQGTLRRTGPTKEAEA